MPYTGDGSAAGARPGHDYVYGPGDVTVVRVDGLTGNNRTMAFQPAGRLISDTDATGQATSYRWDAADRLLTVTSGGRSTATVYDDDAGDGPDRVPPRVHEHGRGIGHQRRDRSRRLRPGHQRRLRGGRGRDDGAVPPAGGTHPPGRGPLVAATGTVYEHYGAFAAPATPAQAATNRCPGGASAN